jgi:hypothetical protein
MKPPNVTLDNMCIIDLEQNREHAHQIRKLVQMHHDKEISLRVVATSASELKQNNTHPQNFNEFKQRISLIGLSDIEILPTLARFDFSFFDYSVIGGRWLDELEKEIQIVLFGENEVEFGDFCRKHGYDKGAKEAWEKWVNRKCDVLTLWSHIRYNGDIFVTNDSNFYKQTKKPRLVELGCGRILTPPEAVKMLDC